MQDMDRFINVGQSLVAVYGLKVIAAIVIFFIGKWLSGVLSRAVGSTLAKNPLPLIIPCHRIIRSDGKMGGFSAPGGITFKKKMLELECKAIRI